MHTNVVHTKWCSGLLYINIMLKNASLTYDVQNMLHTPMIPNNTLCNWCKKKKKKNAAHTLWYPKVQHAPITPVIFYSPHAQNTPHIYAQKCCLGRQLTRFWDTGDMSVQSDAELIICISSSSTFITCFNLPITISNYQQTKSCSMKTFLSFSSKTKSSILKLWVCFFCFLSFYMQKAHFV